VIRPTYNQANLLESLFVNLRGADEPTPFVTYISYNAKGQREIIEYGNGARTHYTYDPLTFRATRLLTIRKQDHVRLQDLNYTFDPVGNITSIRDDARETIFFRNHVVSPSNEYIYDAIYRLISADGREHAGRPGHSQTTLDDSARMHRPIPSDGHALHRYREQYEYDGVGNILKLLHSASDGNWSRVYSYDESHPHPRNNRLTGTRVGQDEEHYAYDAAGNMTRMPHLPSMDWDFKDQLHATCRQEKNAGRSETTYYVYDASGQRVRMVTERASGSRAHERIYLGGFEVYREYDSVGWATLERQTLHVMDDERRVAMVETKTIDVADPVLEPASLIRLQLDNHLGSAVLELDDRAAIISYEEYYPYGSTSFEAGQSGCEVSAKRYRYTGKERDEETGLYYQGARYYAPWLGRWTTTDPTGIADGVNVYSYVGGRPLTSVDSTGLAGDDVVTQNDPLGGTSLPGGAPDPDAPAATAADAPAPAATDAPAPAATDAPAPAATDAPAPAAEVSEATPTPPADPGLWERFKSWASKPDYFSGNSEYLGTPGLVTVGAAGAALTGAGTVVVGVATRLAPAARVAAVVSTGFLVKSSDDAEGLSKVATIGSFGITAPGAPAFESGASTIDSAAVGFENEPMFIEGQKTVTLDPKEAADAADIARFNTGIRRGEEIGYTTYSDRAQTLQAGSADSVNLPSGPNVLTSQHSHPFGSPGIFSGADVRAMLMKPYNSSVTHSVLGYKWSQANIVFKELGLPLESSVVRTSVTQSQVAAAGAARELNWLPWR